MSVGSEAWMPKRAVVSAGMGCKGEVVDGGKVVGASGSGHKRTRVQKQYNK